MNQGKWVRKAKNGINVIFIHGINSSEDCWRNKNGSYWPKLLEDESELADIGIYVFSYRTGLNTGFYSLSDIVDSLREYFKLDNLVSSVGVIFVCHSMGGIVARRFLVNQYSTLIERGLNKIGLFLVASPSLGSEYANMLGLISSVMGHTQANALKFSQANVWLNDLDKDFINLKTNKNLRIKGKELIEDLPLYGKGLIKKQVVKPFSGAKYFKDPFTVPGSDHSTIATPNDRNAVQHRLLVKFIKEFLEEQKSMISLDEAQNFADILNVIISIFDRIYPKLHYLFTGKEYEKEPSIRIEQVEGALVAKKHGVENLRVTYPQLVNLVSRDDLRHIRTFERAMENNLSVIEKEYPEVDLLSTADKAQKKKLLHERVLKIKQDLNAVLEYIELIGLDLEDHYSRARHWLSHPDFFK